ncbi:MAG: hypothetical protein IKX85_06825, partial [Clostridia bacterium]|nr:hypothetical protein [Clostridia bacterium]
MTEKDFAVSVPVYNIHFQRQGREALVESLHALGAKRVFLALQPDCILSPLREKELSLLKENCAFLHAAGFEVGAWLWTFALSSDEGYVRMESPDGKKSTQTVCPADERYREAMGGMIGEIARAGVDLIQFDDDFRYGFQDMGFGCVCDNQIREIEKMTGETLSLPLLKQHLLA